jgi:hypothetical protein
MLVVDWLPIFDNPDVAVTEWWYMVEAELESEDKNV